MEEEAKYHRGGFVAILSIIMQLQFCFSRWVKGDVRHALHKERGEGRRGGASGLKMRK